MAYISKEEVKCIRTALKEEFKKEIKFSVRRENSSSLYVSIIESTYDFSDILENKSYKDLNCYYLPDNDILKTILLIIKGVTYHKDVESIDSDYGNIPSFYINMSIGKWNKPWKMK
jgi:hypothetical protein